MKSSLIDPIDLCFYLQQHVFQKHGHLHQDGMIPSGFNFSRGSGGRGGVVLVDEDTGLINHLFPNRGKLNHHLKPVRNGHLENQRGKLEQSSKLLDENITTDKKTDSNGGTISQFPGKPSDSLTEPDGESPTKKPSLGISELPGIFSDGVTSGDANVTDETSNRAFPESHVIISGPSGKAFPQNWRSATSDQRAKHITELVDKVYSHWWTMTPREGRLVQGSDGKSYRLVRGPPGWMGPPGEDVSPSFIFFPLPLILMPHFFCLVIFN